MEYPNLKVQGMDFSENAIEWVRKSYEFDPSRVIAEVCDLVND